MYFSVTSFVVPRRVCVRTAYIDLHNVFMYFYCFVAFYYMYIPGFFKIHSMVDGYLDSLQTFANRINVSLNISWLCANVSMKHTRRKQAARSWGTHVIDFSG